MPSDATQVKPRVSDASGGGSALSTATDPKREPAAQVQLH